MNRSLLACLTLFAALASAEDLAPAQFKTQLEAQRGLVLDVRTPAEVAKGKLAGASVIDFNGPKFEQKVSLIARDKPVFVYCAKGGRSGQAVALMTKLGFTRVYNLSGGISAWSAEGLPVESGGAAPVTSAPGLSPQEFDALLVKEKRLLVDFQTQWCTPCQKMLPIVDALESVKVLKVDLDASEALGARERVQGVPVFVLYVDGKERARLAGEQTLEALETLAKK